MCIDVGEDGRRDLKTETMPDCEAISAARRRFLIVGGAGQGMTFYDPLNDRMVTVHNVAQWINDRTDDESPVSWKRIADGQWRSLMPSVAYCPNQPVVFEDEEGFNFRNIWVKPEVDPAVNATAEPFVEFLTFAVGEEKANYLIDWFAWQYQRPLDKPHTALYIFGAQGSGKNTIHTTMELVFGPSAVQMCADPDKLKSMSAVDLWSRTLLFTDECEVSINSSLYHQIKSMTGKDYTDADRKHQHFGRYHVPANLIMLSNHPPAFLEKDDRRFYVVEMKPRENFEQYFNGYYRWLREEGGASEVAGLLAQRDISHMTLAGRPPMTPEKERALDLATHQDILDVQHRIQELDQVVFLPEDFTKGSDALVKPARLQHILDDVGLEAVDLNKISGSSRSQAKGFTEAQSKRILILKGAEVFQDPGDHNAWKVKFGSGMWTLDDARRHATLSGVKREF